MEDDLKKYLNENRAFFEDEKPSVDLWSKIENDLQPKKQAGSRYVFLKYAAAAAILLSVGYMSLKFFDQDKIELVEQHDVINQNNKDNQLSSVSSEYEEVEEYYSSKVNLQMIKLNYYEVDAELIQEVENLKTEFESLKIEMGKGADQSMIVEAMINNYRLRLTLLEDLMEALEDTKEMNNKEYETDL